MNPIDRPGTFRGTPLEWAVTTTKNGFPQFVVRLQATEYYNEEDKVWLPWSEYGAEITAYLVLFYEKNGEMVPCFQHENCQRAFGWAEPFAFSSLNDGEWGNLVILFRVEKNDYPGGFPFKVTSIDAADADPIRGIQKLDPKKLSAMDVDPRFKLTAKKAPPKRVAPGSPTPPPKATPSNPISAVGADKAPVSAAPAAEAEKGTTPPAAPSSPKPKTTPKPKKSKTPSEPGKMTKIEAWGKVHEFKTKKVTDDDVTKAWLTAVQKVCPDKQEPDITSTEWATICGETLDQIDHIPF